MVRREIISRRGLPGETRFVRSFVRSTEERRSRSARASPRSDASKPSSSTQAGAFFVAYDVVAPKTGDAFGRVMIANFKDRGAPLLGAAESLDAVRLRFSQYATLDVRRGVPRRASVPWPSRGTREREGGPHRRSEPRASRTRVTVLEHALASFATRETRPTPAREIAVPGRQVRDMKCVYESLVLGQPVEFKRIAALEIFDDPDQFNLIMSHYCFVLAGTGDAAELVDMIASTHFSGSQ